MKLTLITILLMSLVGCGATSGGVQKLGPDTYTVSSQVMFGPGKASASRAAALSEAERFCEGQGKEVLVDGYSTQGHSMSLTGDSEVRFKCLPRNDRDLRRPNIQTAPTVLIQDQRK